MLFQWINQQSIENQHKHMASIEIKRSVFLLSKHTLNVYQYHRMKPQNHISSGYYICVIVSISGGCAVKKGIHVPSHYYA